MIFYDETCDSLGRFVSCILVAPIPPPHRTEVEIFLGDVFFELLTNIIVFQHVMKFVGEFQFPFESIVFYATDNVGYMLLSYKNALKGILLVQHSFQICPNLPLHTPLCYAVQLPLNDASRTTTSYWRMKDKV